jgi:hypothetical protein
MEKEGFPPKGLRQFRALSVALNFALIATNSFIHSHFPSSSSHCPTNFASPKFAPPAPIHFALINHYVYASFPTQPPMFWLVLDYIFAPTTASNLGGGRKEDLLLMASQSPLPPIILFHYGQFNHFGEWGINFNGHRQQFRSSNERPI